MSSEKEWQDACERWRGRLWLNHMEMFHRAATRGERDADAKGEALAFVETDIRYRRIQIVHDAEVLAEQGAEATDRSAAHEMIHAVLAPMSTFVEGLMKRLSETERGALAEPWSVAHESVTSHLTDILTRGPEWVDVATCKHTEGC